MAINYFSPVRLTLALLPELIERAGRIVNISSVAARLGPPAEAAYAASKAALTALVGVDAGRPRGRRTDVRVHVVNPGVIDTELFHLPDNDESIADIEALPVEAMVEPVLDAARRRARSRSTSPAGSPTSSPASSPTPAPSSPARRPTPPRSRRSAEDRR